MSDSPQPRRIAITSGEPAGVGPELTARERADAATRWPDARFTVLGDASLIAARAAIRLASPSTVKRASGHRVAASARSRAVSSGPTPAGSPLVIAMRRGCGLSDMIRAGFRVSLATCSFSCTYEESLRV
ncbi:hypothetical protein CF641_37875 [Burkholderia pseudomallei]|nr:hypothetical protein CF641_37875 [Burkholderia pseudomallei]